MPRKPFAAHRDGRVSVRLPRALRTLVAGPVGELAQLLDAHDTPGGPAADPLAELTGMTDAVDRPVPDDPALRRLRPDAYAADVEDGRAAADYRRLAGGELAALQRSRVATVLESLQRGDRFDLDPAEAQAWLGALNDLRLVLATRLGIVDDELTGVAGSPALHLYVVFGDLQHQLLVALGAPAEF